MDGENNRFQGADNPGVFMVQSSPPPALADGNIAEKWRKWKKKFKIYMEATESSSKSDEAKIAIILYTLGDEAQEIYETFKFTKERNGNFEAVLEAFEAYCVTKKSESICRHVFFQRTQADVETFEEFVTELKRFSMNCSFGETTDGLTKEGTIRGI